MAAELDLEKRKHLDLLLGLIVVHIAFQFATFPGPGGEIYASSFFQLSYALMALGILLFMRRYFNHSLRNEIICTVLTGAVAFVVYSEFPIDAMKPMNAADRRHGLLVAIAIQMITEIVLLYNTNSKFTMCAPK
jgi:hypothetical protein